MQNFTIAIIWLTGPKAGCISTAVKKMESLGALLHIHEEGSVWSEEGGETYRVVALPTRADIV